jgi:hypothetical protein
MAGEVTLTPLLLGLGVDELSTGAALVPRVKAAVQQVSSADCVRLAEEVANWIPPPPFTLLVMRLPEPTIRNCFKRRVTASDARSEECS